MIGSLRYFASRMWAPRYWPKVGAGGVALVVAIFDPVLGPNPRNRRSLVHRPTLVSMLFDTNPPQTAYGCTHFVHEHFCP